MQAFSCDEIFAERLFPAFLKTGEGSFRSVVSAEIESLLVRFGITLVDPLTAGKSVFPALFPEGWSMKPGVLSTDGRLTTWYIYDGQRRQRIRVRCDPFHLFQGLPLCWAELLARFSVQAVMSPEGGLAMIFDRSIGKMIWSTEAIHLIDGQPAVVARCMRKAEALAKEYLDSHYPDWQDPALYWDE